MVLPDVDEQIESVRNILNGVGLKLINDTTITQQYNTCRTYISINQIPNSDESLIEIAEEYWCAYLSAVSYYARQSRELASLPQASEVMIEELRRIAFGFLRRVLPDDDDIFQDGTNPQTAVPIKIPFSMLTRTLDQIDGFVPS